MTSHPGTDCFALLDDCHATAAQPTSRLYTGFVREHRCDDPASLDTMWPAVAADMRDGLQAVILADYEWGARLMKAGHEQIAPEAAGALRVLMFERMARLSAEDVSAWLARREADELKLDASRPAPAGIVDIVPSVDRDAFTNAIHRIHAYIGEGETYQVNYTYRLGFRSFGAPTSLYRRLRARQPVAFGAFIALPAEAGGGHILSCSPELFLRNSGGRLEARPMKGTASRARVPEGDSEIARMLGEDVKNRAENLMIVDLLRNDLGRIARTGSVKVPKLFAIEPYSTVFQMTSTVDAELAEGTNFPDLLRALFPCGSITGAPKHRTMQLIAELENTPRGLYTGSIGWIEPPASSEQACGDFCLSVAIRTLALDPPDASGLRAGRMGVGAGIVIDSRADEEFEECLLKARFLTGLDPGFSLFETMLGVGGKGIRHLDRHLDRLQRSAAALGFACRRAAIIEALADQCAGLAPDTCHRIRLALHKDGSTELAIAALDPLPEGPVRLLLTKTPMRANDPFVGHKTTMRGVYDAAVAEAVRQNAFDMIFHNERGEMTEGGRSNVFALVDGQWITPPLGAGLLPGVMRSVLLDDPVWSAREAPLTLEALRRAERIVVCNALRGAVDAVLHDEAGEDSA
ncbi:aminodeoxychorismate synthase component I [Thauera sp.]|uniref:aminodeoxychorismate synthase component I n=1 Tax=Thauera sp. TaxID=1905334 RepID=UPI00258054C0|nr:aminodeoxychorismate synthase component I [Thauera sp.]